MPDHRNIDKKPIMVLAIGGNALIPDNEHLDIKSQRKIAAKLAVDLVDLIEAGWRIVLTHGNGPHVGIHLLQDEAAKKNLPTYPLDHYVSSTQGEIGYLLQLSIYNELLQRKSRHPIVALTTQVVVDVDDSAFKTPDKPVGIFMTEEDAINRVKTFQWKVVEDSGRGWRRVVPSPKPRHIIELEMIKALIAHDVLVIACGGGGIPVVVDDTGELRGIEAVIDKDRVSSLLAGAMKADVYLIPTGVEKVAINFGKENQQWLDHLTVKEANNYIKEGQFPPGSMLPKIESLLAYLDKNPQGTGIVTTLESMVSALNGKTGTKITCESL